MSKKLKRCVSRDVRYAVAVAVQLPALFALNPNLN